MATSGTVSTTVFRTQKLIDHAFRRCKLSPQQITAEYIQTALDLLFLDLSTLASKGVALWCVEKQILPMYENVQTVPCPIGTVDVLNANLRTSNRLEGTASASEGDAENAFDGDIDTACVQSLPAGSISLALDSGTSAPLFGVLPGANGVWDFSFQGSVDGVTWVELYTAEDQEVVDGEWIWVDVEGVLAYQYYRLKANNLTVLDVREFYIGTLLNEIPLAKVNRDDYANLPNKFFPGRPVQFWYDKQRSQPVMALWPAPQAEYTFSQIILYTQRYVQDVGTLTQEIEVPQRWYLAIMLNLAVGLAQEISEVPPGTYAEIVPERDTKLREAWDSETDSSPTFLMPNISPYTK
jgi:hypothetical protein